MARYTTVLAVALIAIGCSLYSRGNEEVWNASGFDAGQSASGFGPVLLREAPEWNTESYTRIDESAFASPLDRPLSTFGIDVDTASYSNVRRFLRDGMLPPADAVRIEELVNYFAYRYPEPERGAPLSISAEVTACPWAPAHRLVRIGIAAKALDLEQRPPVNLVFLLDVSGSMATPDKLPLVKNAMALLVEQLRATDRVAIVVYAGAAGLVLPATAGDRTEAILAALDALEAGGSTAGGAGIELAYRIAAAGTAPGVVSRVVLATDGDFNVGTTSEGELTRMIEEKARSGVFLNVLGFGTGNLNDATMQALADRGNGMHAYVDTIREARKVFVEQLSGTLVTVAQDVRIQVEWNPLRAAQYRLVGYENRVLAPEDFRDDKKDAGEIGAGHTVTALYEVVPAGANDASRAVDPLRYQAARGTTKVAAARELLTVKLRWQPPGGGPSVPSELAVDDEGGSFASATPDTRFAAAVASFGLLLRESPHRGEASWDAVLATAEDSAGGDAHRREFVEVARRARELAAQRTAERN
jgi:Ca-activated chloride channel family protein